MNTYDWKLYLNFSKWLLTEESTLKPDAATIHRNVVSRSYYAAFHVAQDYLIQNDYWELDINGTEHKRTWSIFLNIKKKDKLFQSKCRAIGNLLRNLCDKRNDADYHADKQFTQKETKLAYGSAKKVIIKIGEL